MTTPEEVPGLWRVRVSMLGLATVVAAMVLGARLYHVQAIEGNSYAWRAHQNTIYDEPIRARRGLILDAHGRVMVGNTPRFSLELVRNEVRDLPETVRALAEAMGESPEQMTRRLRHHAQAAPWEPLELVHALSTSMMARLAPRVHHLAGVSIVAHSMRRYPMGNLASHVLGTLGEISAEELGKRGGREVARGDPVGKNGLEKRYDRNLRGLKGTRQVYVDALGRTLRVVSGQRPTPGLNLHLSLDSELQRVAENALAKTLRDLHTKNHERSSGAVVVMGAQTGAILALASLPNFSNAVFARGIKGNELLRLQRDPTFPLYDRAIQGAFPPGSTFKMINASASLQEHVCTPNSNFYCGGYYEGFHCFVRSGHGHINFTDAIAMSCDVTFYRLGDRLGIDRLASYAKLFGLGHPTGLDLPDEEGGLVPSPEWKQRVLHQPWWPGETIVTAIGQGQLVATPLQMAVVAAAVANGGRVLRPYLVERGTSWNGERVWTREPECVRHVPVKARFLAAVRRGMRGAVLHGTSTAADSDLVHVAGKTGTAENLPTPDNPKGRNHVWFTCFAPYEHPEIVVVVFVEKAGGFGGSVSAPVARTIIDWYFTQRGYRPHRKGAA